MLGCWRGLLLPCSPDPSLAQEAFQLQESLQECGWEYPDSALLKVSSGNEEENNGSFPPAIVVEDGTHTY